MAQCTVGVPGGGTMHSGQSVTAYSAATSTYPTACSSISETRTCTNGTLSGSFTNASCSDGTPAPCSLPWGGSTAHGTSVTAYAAANVAYGGSCSSISRGCTNGTLSGNALYAFGSCSVNPPATCVTPWGATIAHGGTVLAYQAATVNSSATCVSETQTCTNGTLSGSYTNDTCSVVVLEVPQTIAGLKLWLDASDDTKVTLTYNSLGITATGSSGANTLTVSANTGLMTGARIRLGTAGSPTVASAYGAHTYNVDAISGTTAYVSPPLSQGYSTQAIYQGYVIPINDKSGNGYHATQTTVANMPLWVSNGKNAKGTMYYGPTASLVNTAYTNGGSTSQTSFITFNSTSYDNSDTRILTIAPQYVGIGTSFYQSYYWSIVHDGVAWGTTSTISPGDSAYRIFSLTNNNGASYLYNGSSTVISSSTAGTSPNTGYLVKAPTTGNVTDVISYNSVLAAGGTNWTTINDYEKEKWEIPSPARPC